MRAGRLAIATALGQDFNDLDAYQPGRWFPGIWQCGDDLYCCSSKTTPPRYASGDWEWVRVPGTEWFTKQYAMTIWVHVAGSRAAAEKHNAEVCAKIDEVSRDLLKSPIPAGQASVAERLAAIPPVIPNVAPVVPRAAQKAFMRLLDSLTPTTLAAMVDDLGDVAEARLAHDALIANVGEEQAQELLESCRKAADVPPFEEQKRVYRRGYRVWIRVEAVIPGGGNVPARTLVARDVNGDWRTYGMMTPAGELDSPDGQVQYLFRKEEIGDFEECVDPNGSGARIVTAFILEG